MQRFESKTALITGGTKGLGLAIAKRLAKEGARPVVCYRSDSAGKDEALAELKKLHPGAEALSLDLSEQNAADSLFEQVSRLTSSLDFFIYNAAATVFKPLADLKPHHIDKTFNISVKTFLLSVQKLAPLIANGGSIVTVSGMDTFRAVPGHGLLAGAKAALEMFTKYLAHELASQGIRVNGVNPGFLSTDSTRLLLGEKFALVEEHFSKTSPLKRKPSLDEVAAVIAFLCSDDSSWMVGEILNVDGGQDFSLGPIREKIEGRV